MPGRLMEKAEFAGAVPAAIDRGGADVYNADIVK